MAAILENPAIRDMMSNPEMVRRMMMANPHTREVMENNPEVAQMLNDPSFLRQSLDMARNPKLMKQALRNNDRALSNLEMVPGGFNHLRRMYHSVQEPMEASRSVPDPSTDDLNEQFAARLNADTRPHAGQLNTTALPNPWAPPPRPQHTPSRFPLFPGMPGLSANSPGSIGSGFNPFASPFANSEGHGTSTGSGTGTQQGNNNSSSNSSNNNANALNSPLGALLGQRMGGLGGGPQPSPFGFPMGEAFPPMGNNPEMFQQVLQFNQMMRQMQQQQQPPSHHPMAGGFPAFANMFRGVPLVPETSRSSIIDTVNPSNIIINPTSGNGTTSATTSDTSAASANSETSVASESSIQSLEQRYESQLASLRDMGFRDDSRNMRALLASGGDVSSAIEYLLLEGRM
ncbi:MAG: hypothetical protein J3Q66DRAFT_11970 [Benniella sp.]|nr:MAG: hypothetical protein J3Q66DRAFT_11970 [Benniella sp.]